MLNILRAVLMTKETWNVIREIMKPHKNNTMNIVGKQLMMTEVETTFNDLFVNVGPSTENTIANVPNIYITNKVF